MTAKLEMSDEAYATLIEDVAGVKNVAYQVRGLVPNHIWSRLDYLATDLQSVMRDGVDVVKDEDDPAVRAKSPDGRTMRERVDAIFDSYDRDVTDPIGEEERRFHINLEEGVIT